jgi:hypothetical protein
VAHPVVNAAKAVTRTVRQAEGRAHPQARG